MKLPLRAQLLDQRLVAVPGQEWMSGEVTRRLIADGKAALLRAVPFRIDNVTQYLFAETDQEHWTLSDDFPNVAPPFHTMWFETNGPTDIVSSETPEHLRAIHDRVQTDAALRGTMRDMQWGVLWRSFDVDDADIPVELSDEMILARRKGARWAVAATLAMRQPDGVLVYPIAMHRFDVLPSGKAVDEGILSVPPSIAKQFGEIYQDAETGVRFAINAMSTYFFPVYLAVSFCHCKNVLRIENSLGRHERRHEERAGRAFVRYYTLEINPMREVIRREGGEAEVGTKKAMHIVRGHFATYSQEHPLFGRYSGTFWKPMHVRGDITKGIASKDYVVQPLRERAE